MNASQRVMLDMSVLIDIGVIDLGDYRESEGVVSAVTIAELFYGLDVDDPVERLTRTQRLESVVADFDILAFDLRSARFYGTLASLVKRAGRNPQPRRLDLQIAATAAAHQMPLLTRNPIDFRDLHALVQIVPV